jgi:hypothetical protein
MHMDSRRCRRCGGTCDVLEQRDRRSAHIQNRRIEFTVISNHRVLHPFLKE